VSKHILNTPLQDEDIRDLRIGDVFYLSGLMATGRDSAHKRLLLENKPLPLDLSGHALYHAGPIAQQGDGSWKIISAGPTTSMRMERLEAEFIEATGIKVIVGKGGMKDKTAEACARLGAVHAVYPGGCGVLAAKQIRQVEAVYWEDLGMPEAVWVCRIEEFGPLVVTIDTLGNNLFESSKREYSNAKQAALQVFSQKLNSTI